MAGLVSWQATDWADSLPHDAVKHLAYRVLVKYANVAAQDGSRAWRNSWEVARELGVAQRSVIRATRELQAADLIRLGDQRAVAHIQGNRRPVVYDLNFGWHRMYSQPELALPEDDEDDLDSGVTQLSTGAPGVTSGVTTAVPLGTNGTIYNQVKEEPYVPERAQARNTDALSRGPHSAATASPGYGLCGHSLIDDRHCIYGCLPSEVTA